MSDSSSESEESYFSLDDEVETKPIREKPIIISYLKTYLRQLKDADERLEDVELDFKTDEVTISGTERHVASAFTWIQDIIHDLIRKEKSIKVPGIAKYLADKKGINFLQRIAKSCSCTQEITQQSQIKLEHTTGDISNFQDDIIVTSTSPQDFASCDGSETSKALLKRAGNGLKDACRTASDPKLQTGDVLATNGFSLSCKEVYHVLLSHYNPADGEGFLRKSIKTCLKMAEKSGHSSIAFPCLGVAEFSYPTEEVVKVLEQEIKSFDSVHLRKASVVVPPAVNAIIPQTSTPNGSTALKVTFGDISKFQADVIVTSSSAQNVSSCAGSVISRALLKQAGDKIQEACKKASSGNHSVGEVIKTPGFKLYCQEVYHVVLDNFDQSNGEQVLKKTITNCLNLAEKSGYRSMAFPALGAGGFQFPPELVVRCFDEVVKNYNGSSLHDIYLVVFSSDKNVTKAAENVLSINVLQTTLTISKEKKVMVFVKQGDITTTTCDVIVNSTKQFDLSGQVGKALVAKAGKSIEDECNKKPVKSTTNMRVTSGGNLCKYILHLDTPTDTDELEKLLYECFCEADGLGVDSLAIPPVGTGGIGLSSGVVGKCMASAIDKFNGSKPKNVKKIEVFVFVQNMVSDFKFLTKRDKNDQKTPNTRVNCISVSVHQGDITSSKCDALVNSTKQFDLSGQVGKALVAKAGKSIEDECSKNPKKSTTNMRVTSGGNLCKYILHLSTPTDTDELEKLLFECFCEADALGVDSLAMPPVGTGGIGLSSSVVAKCMASAIDKFNEGKPKNVKKIEVFVFMKKMVPDFQGLARQAQNVPKVASKGLNFISVSVRPGDITSSTCDALVNSTKQFNLSSQVSKALIAKAGQTIVDECTNNPISSTNNMRVTSGGNLCKYILHLATPNDTSQLEQVLFDCFAEADKLGVQSLAVPPAGTGAIGLSSGTVAKCLASAINKFDQTKPNNLKQIIVYVYQIAMLNGFQREVVNIPTKALRSSKQFTKSGFQPTVTSTVCVEFCSQSKENIDKAFAKLEKKVDELSFTQNIKDEAIKNFTPDEEQELQNLMTSESVLIEQVSNTELKIQGIKTNESSAFSKVNQIISEFKQALYISDYVEWWYLHPTDSKLRKFPVRASFELENAYKKNNRGQINVTVHDAIPNLYLAVDFAKMEANTGVSTCKVDRRLISERPQIWNDMGDETVMKVPVAANCSEFQNVLQNFQKTLKVDAISLHRIQNITQWNQFHEQKKKIEKKMPNQPVTRELFHGTDAATSEIILKDTFDRSHAGKNATHFGKGVYFATTAQYSHRFTNEDSQGNRCMFLAEVITGTPCVGNKDTHTIPMQADSTPFDSVVDNVKNPVLFVVFRDTSVYPLYLLTYKT